MAAAQLGKIEFVILAKNERQLAALWNHIMANANLPLDTEGIKSCILIEASVLPTRKASVATPHPEPHL